MTIDSVCVFCGASSGNNPIYIDAATSFGAELVQQGIRLVYGGGGSGLMGSVADSVLKAGGEVTGVIPNYLKDRELGHENLTNMEIVGSMHERKQRMFELADAIVALPGGVGTLEEVLEIITWKQLGMHNKPIILLNISGYWQHLNDLILNTIAHGFAVASTKDLYEMNNHPTKVIPALKRIQQSTTK